MREIKTKHGHCLIGEDVHFEEGAIVDVKFGIFGDRTLIRSGARVEGTCVTLGKECYLDHGAWIGGGSCWDDEAWMCCGDWLHMGWNSQINIGRGVDIGDEVGIGIETKIFTHGVYLPIDEGFPVQWGPVFIGNKVWLPNAIVTPNVLIGDNVVVGAMSLVNKDLPSGCFAAGIPVEILHDNNWYPKKTEVDYEELLKPTGVDFMVCNGNDKIVVGDTSFNISARIIYGPVHDDAEKIKNQLRRNGIRFKYTGRKGEYVPW